MNNKKVHMWVFNQAASDGFNDGTVDRDVYLNQTKCGYVRELVTTNGNDVTCFYCANLIKKEASK
jgi:hypothetical protein